MDEITGYQIGSGYYALDIGPTEAKEIADIVMPLLEKAWQQGHDHYKENFSPNFPEYNVNPYTVKDSQ